MGRQTRLRVFALACGLLTVAAACGTDGTTLQPVDPKRTTTSTDVTTSTTSTPESIGPAPVATAKPTTFALVAPFTDGSAIDSHYTCFGDSVLPGLSWGTPPAETAELAITITDTSSNDFLNWVIAGIPPNVVTFPDGIPPAGSHQALNDTTAVGYAPPCPPKGATHTYTITLYALKAPSGVLDKASGHVATGLIKTHAQAQATLTFTATGK